MATYAATKLSFSPHSMSVLDGDIDETIGSWRQGLHGIQQINRQGINTISNYVIEPARTTGSHPHPARTLGRDYIDVVESYF
jgi:hypothetical protein